MHGGGHAERPPAPPGFSVRRGTWVLACALLSGAALPGPGSAQEVAPRNEDAELPPPGEIRLRAAPIFQSWHQEFGPDGAEVPLARDLEGPLLEQVFPGPEAVLDGLNSDADALGFAPVSRREAAVGSLAVRELNTEIRTVALRIEAGIHERLAADLMVPLVRTEVEPFLSLDAAGATLGGAAAAVADRTVFFGSIAAARDDLESLIESGDLSAEREEEARELLEASGAFASALETRVVANALLPLAGSRAGSEIEAFYGQLRSGFESFDLSLPSFSLPAEGDPAFLDSFFVGTLASEPPEADVRGWLAGETELGLRFGLLRTGATDRRGLRLRTTLGVRVRLPLRDANAEAFVDPTRLLSEPLGDGQPDVELSLYQDVGLDGWLDVSTTFRYGIQRPDALTVALRSPDRPLALPDRRVSVERDLGDYLRARVAPRARINPFLSAGVEYRFWHKRRDSFRSGDGAGASSLELESEETRHRIGVGATYRPQAPDEGEGAGSVPELGVVYQTPISGSGGETPAAGLVTFHLRVPVRVF